MGWMELMLIGVVALIVVGPKDLPVMFQALGKMSAKVKRMARDFSGAMNDAANATGANDIAKDLKGLTSAKSLGIDKLKDAADKFDKWEPGKETKAMGSETAKLAAERAEAARKIKAKTAEVAQARLDREKEARIAAETGDPASAPAASKPDSAASKTTKPKVTKPKTTKPKATMPKAAKPAAEKATKPKTTKPKTTKPKATKPKADDAK